jgi:hypothetical protein
LENTRPNSAKDGLCGSIDADTASIDASFAVVGSWQVGGDSEYRIALLADDAVTLYEAAFDPSEVDHADISVFSMAVPALLLNRETSEVRVYRDNTLLLLES